MKAYAYLRVSGVSQIEGDGLIRQRRLVQLYADKNQIEIVSVFSDEGVSGKLELENRPGLADCLSQVEAGDVKLVLVETADRLARDAVVSELIIRQFQKVNAKVVSVSGGVDLTDGNDSNPTAKLIRQVLAAVAEFDRCMTVLKLKGARDRMRARGERVEGRKPYGFRTGESDVVKQMLTMYDVGQTLVSISDTLNAAKILPRAGQKWHPATVRRIIKRVS